MTIAMAVCADVLPSVVEIIGEAVSLKAARTATELRRQLHQIQPKVFLLDERIGGSRFKAISTVPRVHRVRSRPRVIALLQSITEKKEQLALMAGCFDAIDLSAPSWQNELREAIRIAQTKRRARVPKVGASFSRVSPSAPETPRLVLVTSPATLLPQR
jgi:hypothetical protein